MKTIRTIALLLTSILMQVIFILPKLIIFSIQIVETVLKIVREQITFLMEQIKNEVLKPQRYVKDKNETPSG